MCNPHLLDKNVIIPISFLIVSISYSFIQLWLYIVWCPYFKLPKV